MVTFRDVERLAHGARSLPTRVLELFEGGMAGLRTQPLWDLLLLVHRGGPKWHWLLKQLLVMAGLAIDTFLPQVRQWTDPQEAGVVSARRRRKDPALVSSLLKRHIGMSPATLRALGRSLGLAGEWVGAAQRSRLCQYFFSLRRHFHEPSVLTVAVDASTVGGRNTL
eukprot:8004283-Lingulodinium_polyedra.AAC.1